MIVEDDRWRNDSFVGISYHESVWRTKFSRKGCIGNIEEVDEYGKA